MGSLLQNTLGCTKLKDKLAYSLRILAQCAETKEILLAVISGGSKMSKRLTEVFEDDTKSLCVGRVSLVLGLVITAFTATVDMDIETEVTWAEAVLRASPAIVGLVAYIFTRLAEMKEWVADLTKNLAKVAK